MRIIRGDALEVLRTMPDASVNCCVTSPPYWGLRDYGVPGQLGLERTPGEYVARMVEVFRELRRVLLDDGTLWLNIGDSYAGSGKGGNPEGSPCPWSGYIGNTAREAAATVLAGEKRVPPGLKPKDLVGIPWRLAFALQEDGWWLRSDIIWHKPNPMPESVRDRPTKAHEYVFLLSKSERYYYDAEAVSERSSNRECGNIGTNAFAVVDPLKGRTRANLHKIPARQTRNCRSVWTIATQPFSGAHFATFPEELARRCILAGCPEGGTVLDPFGGSGTVGVVAALHRRDAVLVELNPDYCRMADARIAEATRQQSLLTPVVDSSVAPAGVAPQP